MKIYLVGGAIRDKLLGLPVKERDWVVVGATTTDMQRLGYQQVGKDFPVFLHPTTHEEYALARMERKTGPGYKGFAFETSPQVLLADDLRRRDLTINAMAESDDGQLIDPYQGKTDLENKVLRHVSSAFSEDPVRILRVARFMARYAPLGFHIAPETMELMKSMVVSGEINALVAERVWKELQRALGENSPEKFFTVLAECGALAILFPHLHACGPGIHALATASLLSYDSVVRFAVLWHALPEDREDKTEKSQEIKHLCKRYAIPNEYQQLALLTGLHYQTAQLAENLSPSALLDFFNILDIYRREERFKKFLQASHAILQSLSQPFDPRWLTACAQAVKAYDIKPLLAQGLTGESLAKQLRIQREAIIKEYIRCSR